MNLNAIFVSLMIGFSFSVDAAQTRSAKPLKDFHCFVIERYRLSLDRDWQNQTIPDLKPTKAGVAYLLSTHRCIWKYRNLVGDSSAYAYLYEQVKEKWVWMAHQLEVQIVDAVLSRQTCDFSLYSFRTLKLIFEKIKLFRALTGDMQKFALYFDGVCNELYKRMSKKRSR